MTRYLQKGTANASYQGPFVTSRETADCVLEARRAVGYFLNCASEEVLFGQNMTSLTLSFSRAIVRTLPPGSDILVTDMDHDANITPWELAASEAGCQIRHVPVDAQGCLSLAAFQQCLTETTSLVAFSLASNATGSLTPAREIISLAHESGALVFVDGVHFAAHKLIDVKALDCDFLACSAYKFFGPHIGIMYGKKAYLESITPYKLKASANVVPSRWETGTQNFEAMAGVTACMVYLSTLSGMALSRQAIETSFGLIDQHERELSRRFLSGIREVPGVSVYGFPKESQRTSTFGITVDTQDSGKVAKKLGDQGIFCWSGHFYAVELIKSLKLQEQGGMIRIGFMHYNTLDEVSRVISALAALGQ